MAHQSFENDQVAKILNRAFVCIKVDREERPDVDEVYMNFVQMLTGRGGWPLSIFLNEAKAPFFGGTYWPKDDQAGHAGFISILLRIEELWNGSREELNEAANYYGGALENAIKDQVEPSDGVGFDATKLIGLLRAGFDSTYGGFGKAPKFPPHSSFPILLHSIEGRDMAIKTLEEMAMGGICDHVGGGLHRYSTDREWHVPHFEKMLYDNALLLRSFASASKLGEIAPSQANLFKQVENGIVGWLEREMLSEEGLFYSAVDADSEGEEGKYYTWTYSELLALEDGAEFASAYGCVRTGNFYDEASGLLSGQNILHRQPGSKEFPAQFKDLLDKRSQRVSPQIDDKAIVAWNGLALIGLVHADRLDIAVRCADSILSIAKVYGSLPRYIWRGEPKGGGYLEDYAYFALGLLALGKREPRFQREGKRLGREMISLFYDRDRGGFFSTTADHESLFGRAKPVFDQPIPSANAAALEVLLELGESLLALQTARAFEIWMDRAPLACESLIWAARDLGGALPLAKFEAQDWSLQDCEFRVNLEIEVESEWSISLKEGALIVAVSGTALRCGTYLARLEGGRHQVEFSGQIDFDPFELTVKYQICGDRECLPFRTVNLPLSPQARLEV
jgi:uncharacterized protein YyaL (SSP411 family)